jgi:hypothetical protein
LEDEEKNIIRKWHDNEREIEFDGIEIVLFMMVKELNERIVIDN